MILGLERMVRHMARMERRRVRKLFADLPPEEGVGMYGFRRYFALYFASGTGGL